MDKAKRETVPSLSENNPSSSHMNKNLHAARQYRVTELPISFFKKGLTQESP